MSFIINPYAFATGGGFTGLLDTYTGATVAYSVRLLSSTYSGALVRIRRSSDNAEKDFYPDTSNELSMSSEDGAGTSLSTWISTDSGYIVTWYDQSGNGNNLARTVASNQPRIVNAGTLETSGYNSKPAIYFDGTDDYLTLGSNIATTQLFYQSYVFDRGSTGIHSVALCAATGTPFVWLWFNNNAIYSGMGGTQLHDSSQTGTGDYLATCLRDSSNNVKIFRNGSADTTKTQADAGQNLSQICNRNGNYTTGYMQELIYWNSDQESNRSGIESDTNSHFSIW